MQTIENNKFFNDLAKEFNISIPHELGKTSAYEEIEDFKDFEYIYCIAYEMLIRTDEYNSLLNQYDSLMESTNQILPNERVAQLDELITQMNELGLNHNSFIGFDCANGNVFEKIRLYDEISSSPWSVRSLEKFTLKSTTEFENVLDQLIEFYYKKKELYVVKDDAAEIKKYIKTSIHPRSTYGIDDKIFIPCIDSDSPEKAISYKSLKDTIYLKELNRDFLLTLKESRKKNLLNQMKLDYKVSNDFWYKYTLNDVKYGIDELIVFYINNGKIQRFQDNENSSSNKSEKITSFEVFLNLASFCIPCMDDSRVSDKTTMTQISKNMPLNILENSFLSTLEFANLKGKYIETEPMYSRPKLLFDEARLINLPVNLNLSKEELLFYIAQIKDDYDDNKDIVKDVMEYMFDFTLESDITEMPENIKYVGEKSTTKKLIPNERKKFKKSLASAFYIYDLYKFFIPLFDKKIKDIKMKTEQEIHTLKETAKSGGNIINHEEITEIEKHAKGKLNINITTEIGYLLDDLSEEQIEYYLSTMKEFIHGINLKDENSQFKKEYDPKKLEKVTPKYKDLIIGDSYILNSNKADLVKGLID